VLIFEGLMLERYQSARWTVELPSRCFPRSVGTSRACLGELIQIDGSDHRCFKERAPARTLPVFIDDATGRLMTLHFTATESTFSYCHSSVLLTASAPSHRAPLAGGTSPAAG
jgi:hypothetical protein